MQSNLQSLAKPMVLKVGQEVVGFYRKMSRDSINTNLIIEQDNTILKLTFKRGSTDEKIVHEAFLYRKHNIMVAIKKLDDNQRPLEILRLPSSKKDYSSIQTVNLITNQKIIGFYKELQKFPDKINLILETAHAQIIGISFPQGSTEAEIVKSTLCKIKHNVQLRIQKTGNQEKPILLEIIPNHSTKNQSIYLDKLLVKSIDPYCDPSNPNARKRYSNAIITLTEIVKSHKIVVALQTNNILSCNKMQKIGKADRFYCSLLGAPIGKKYCSEKCIVAGEIQKIKGGI